jgi:hypothetical protein
VRRGPSSKDFIQWTLSMWITFDLEMGSEAVAQVRLSAIRPRVLTVIQIKQYHSRLSTYLIPMITVKNWPLLMLSVGQGTLTSCASLLPFMVVCLWQFSAAFWPVLLCALIPTQTRESISMLATPTDISDLQKKAIAGALLTHILVTA